MGKKNPSSPKDRLGRAVAMARKSAREREETAAGAEPWRKVTVVLKNRQIVFLDAVALQIRARSGAAIARAEIIRALIDAVEAAGIDLTAATSEEEIRGVVADRLS